jgi:hypothetical protein
VITVIKDTMLLYLLVGAHFLIIVGANFFKKKLDNIYFVLNLSHQNNISTQETPIHLFNKNRVSFY